MQVKQSGPLLLGEHTLSSSFSPGQQHSRHPLPNPPAQPTLIILLETCKVESPLYYCFKIINSFPATKFNKCIELLVSFGSSQAPRTALKSWAGLQAGLLQSCSAVAAGSTLLLLTTKQVLNQKDVLPLEANLSRTSSFSTGLKKVLNLTSRVQALLTFIGTLFRRKDKNSG